MRIHFQRFKTLSIKGREMPVEEGPEDLVGRLDELGRGQSRGGLGKKLCAPEFRPFCRRYLCLWVKSVCVCVCVCVSEV